MTWGIWAGKRNIYPTLFQYQVSDFLFFSAGGRPCGKYENWPERLKEFIRIQKERAEMFPVKEIVTVDEESSSTSKLKGGDIYDQQNNENTVQKV
jgi:hypothetical protein